MYPTLTYVGFSELPPPPLPVPPSQKNFRDAFDAYFEKEKTTFICWTRLKTETFSNCQATYQKELCLLFENQANFFTERTDRLDPLLHPPSLPVVILVCFLRKSVLFEWPLSSRVLLYSFYTSQQMTVTGLYMLFLVFIFQFVNVRHYQNSFLSLWIFSSQSILSVQLPHKKGFR